MSWLVEKKGKKYRLWSTMTDNWLTPWLDRNKILDFIEQTKIAKIKYEMEETRKNFPYHWSNKEGKCYQIKGE